MATCLTDGTPSGRRYPILIVARASTRKMPRFRWAVGIQADRISCFARSRQVPDAHRGFICTLGNSPPSKQERRSQPIDRVLNICLVIVVFVGIASMRLPIFSNELYVPSAIYDFGNIKAGVSVMHEFRLINLHPWPVLVTDVKTSCGCTRAAAKWTLPYRLMPFHTITLPIVINTSGKLGIISENILVETNDNKNELIYRVQGKLH